MGARARVGEGNEEEGLCLRGGSPGIGGLCRGGGGEDMDMDRLYCGNRPRSKITAARLDRFSRDIRQPVRLARLCRVASRRVASHRSSASHGSRFRSRFTLHSPQFSSPLDARRGALASRRTRPATTETDDAECTCSGHGDATWRTAGY